MDRERFGRALGQGAREAAKAVMKAADAAASPDPKAVQARQQVGRSAGTAVRQGVVEAKTTGKGIKEGGRRFGEAMWGPFVRAGGQLWLELTGVFFGLFALSAAIEVVRQRSAFAAGGEEARKGWFAVVMLAVFGYFALTSFLRAHRRGKRR
jgi:hypothetical protein